MKTACASCAVKAKPFGWPMASLDSGRLAVALHLWGNGLSRYLRNNGSLSGFGGSSWQLPCPFGRGFRRQVA